MFRRSNPWPSFVDLFSALLLAAFGALILSVRPAPPDPRVREMKNLMEDMQQQLKAAGMEAELDECGAAEICLHLEVHFQTDADVIYQANEAAALRRACQTMKRGLDRLNAKDRDKMTLLVEGHADRRLPQGELTERERFLYNWRLSSARAASVLYEFKDCGLVPPEYDVSSLGKADTDPRCTQHTEECYRKNRRTTLRLQVDTRKLESSR